MSKSYRPESYYVFSTTKKPCTCKRVKIFKLVDGQLVQYQLIKLDGIYYLPVEIGDKIAIQVENKTSNDLGLLVRIQTQNVCLSGSFHEKANYENGLLELKAKSQVTVDSFINNTVDMATVAPLEIRPEYLGFPISLFTKHVINPKEDDAFDHEGDPLWVEYGHISRQLFSIRMVTQAQIDSNIHELNK